MVHEAKMESRVLQYVKIFIVLSLDNFILREFLALLARIVILLSECVFAHFRSDKIKRGSIADDLKQSVISREGSWSLKKDQMISHKKTDFFLKGATSRLNGLKSLA